MFSAYCNPLERSVGDGDLLRGVGVFGDAESHGGFEAGTEYGVGLVKLAAGIVAVERSSAYERAINFDVCAGGDAGDVEGFGVGERRERKSSQPARDGGEIAARQFSHCGPQVRKPRCHPATRSVNQHNHGAAQILLPAPQK
jgi:hypothetical protein